MKIDTTLLPDDNYDYEYPLPYGWEKQHTPSMSEEKVLEVRRLAKQYNKHEHLSVQDDRLAEQFGVSRSTIRQIRARVTFKDIR